MYWAVTIFASRHFVLYNKNTNTTNTRCIKFFKLVTIYCKYMKILISNFQRLKFQTMLNLIYINFHKTKIVVKLNIMLPPSLSTLNNKLTCLQKINHFHLSSVLPRTQNTPPNLDMPLNLEIYSVYILSFQIYASETYFQLENKHVIDITLSNKQNINKKTMDKERWRGVTT